MKEYIIIEQEVGEIGYRYIISLTDNQYKQISNFIDKVNLDHDPDILEIDENYYTTDDVVRINSLPENIEFPKIIYANFKSTDNPIYITDFISF